MPTTSRGSSFLAPRFRDDEPPERANRSKRVDPVERWRDVIADEPELPGVWRRQGGGFRVRGRTIDPRSGKNARSTGRFPPRELLDVLRWHVNEQILHTKTRESELLFPSVTGGFRARSALDKPFDEARARK